MTQHRTWTAPPGAPRLDRALAEAFPDLSRARLQALISEGRVRVDGAPAKASGRLPAGTLVELDVPEVRPPTVEGESIPLDILHEDEDVIVVVKPAHMVVHPSAGHGKSTLVHALVGRGGPLSEVGGVERPGIVHRLDAGTSGVMVVARNDIAHRRLSEMFARHDLDRRYLAVVHRVPLHDGGTAVSAIARDPTNRLRMASVPERTDMVFDEGFVFEEDEDEGYVVSRATAPDEAERAAASRRGRRAVTHWRVRARGDRVALVECKLETGRTHQVRVHLSEMGHPILADSLYGRRECVAPGSIRARVDAVDHPLLHAFHLAFAHPRTGASLAFTYAPPPDFLEVCAAAGLPVPQAPGPFA